MTRKPRKTQLTQPAPEWAYSQAEVDRLRHLKAANDALPEDSPRVLLSIRLSVFTQDTTSPIRQEIDLREKMLEKRWRVVGIASDLDVSATKTPPWKRPQLGKWLNDRVPEYDYIAFWKLDRFIRSLTDLNVMLRWAKDHSKSLFSLNDKGLDLDSDFGPLLIQFIGFVAQIESANTKLRVENMWAYNKTQSEWITGRPPYGYRVHRHKINKDLGICACGAPKESDGKKTLIADDDQEKALKRARDLLIAGFDLDQIVARLNAEDLMQEENKYGEPIKLTVTSLARRLGTPATRGIRVEMPPSGGKSVSGAVLPIPVLDKKGDEIKVGPAIFTQDEWDEIQEALARRPRRKLKKQNDASPFLGVLKCADCDSNLSVMNIREHDNGDGYKRAARTYLKCYGPRKCKSGGAGAHPASVYEALINEVLETTLEDGSLLGDKPVLVRQFTKGSGTASRVKDLQTRINSLMDDLDPVTGRYAKNAFARERAEEKMDALLDELNGLDPDEGKDRWTHISLGETFRERWAKGDMYEIGEDMRRAGLTCTVQRSRSGGRQSVVDVEFDLEIPKDVVEGLTIKPDAFANPV